MAEKVKKVRTAQQIGKLSKNKGKRYERKIANKYRNLGYTVRRGWQARGGSDGADVQVQGFPFWIECKHYKRCGKAFRAMDQAIEEIKGAGSKQTPLVHIHEDGGEDLVVLRLKDWMEIVKSGDAVECYAAQMFGV